jgi:hypothetical protein
LSCSVADEKLKPEVSGNAVWPLTWLSKEQHGKYTIFLLRESVLAKSESSGVIM